MTPLCSGPSGCGYTDSSCTIAPLSNDCNNPMLPLRSPVCGSSTWCAAMQKLVNYMAGSGWDGCGVEGTSWCKQGSTINNGFALCTKQGVTLLTQNGWTYSKVPVTGYVTDSAIISACSGAGMTPLCSGPSGCSFTDSSCTIAPLSNDCGNPMLPLRSPVCGSSTWCTAMQKVVNYMAGTSWDGCGVEGTSWCKQGSSISNGFALCTKQTSR